MSPSIISNTYGYQISYLKIIRLQICKDILFSNKKKRERKKIIYWSEFFSRILDLYQRCSFVSKMNIKCIRDVTNMKIKFHEISRLLAWNWAYSPHTYSRVLITHHSISHGVENADIRNKVANIMNTKH